MTQNSGRLALAFIFITVLAETIGFGIILPVIPGLIVELTGTSLSKAALYGGWLGVVYALMQFLFAPVIGNLSDRYGRRPVLLFSLFVFGIDYLLMGFAPSIAWLFAGRMIAGIAGAAYTPAYAYVADVTPPERRAQNFGLLGAAFGIGFIVGPVIGGLLGEFGPRAPFFTAAALALANMIYGYIVLPETLPADRRRPFSWKRANTLGALAHLRRFPALTGLAGVLLLHMLAHNALPSIWSFYTIEKFGWSPRDIGYSLGAVGILMAIVQGGLIRTVIPRIGAPRAAYIGLLLAALGFFGYAFATQGWFMYVFTVPAALMGLVMPSIQGIMSGIVPANAQGELQGGMTSISSLTAIVSPLFMTQLFGFFTSAAAPFHFPGASFLAAALLELAALLLLARVIRAAATRSGNSS